MALLQMPIYYLILVNCLLFQTTLTSNDVAMRFTYNPRSIEVPVGDTVSFECSTNIIPEKFEWRILPDWPPSMTKARTVMIKDSQTSITRYEFDVNENHEGSYQCVAMYGSEALASIPALLRIAKLDEFPKQESIVYSVSPGNTVVLQCPLPRSIPPPTLQYFKNKQPLANIATDRNPAAPYVIQNITKQESGNYSCSASNYVLSTEVEMKFDYIIKVSNTKPTAPKFLRIPSNKYTVQANENITLECSAVGTPPPSIYWRKLNDEPLPHDRIERLPIGLRLIHVQPSDEGIYICEANNKNMPYLTHHISLILHGKPEIVAGPLDANVTENDNLELNCTVKGTPEPTILWVINGRDVSQNKYIEVIGNMMFISSVQKEHAGIVQCFATNPLGTVYSVSRLTVFPKQRLSITSPTSPRRKVNGKNLVRKKDSKMIPPSRPNITRLSDNSVMVRWNVPDKDGMPIKFFKVQYKEISIDESGYDKSSKWRTLNAEIPPGVKTYEVDNLYPNTVYKFRIAAVYANDDNKNGPNSARFHLKEGSFSEKNPLPVPILQHTEAINETSVKIYWDLPTLENVTIDGFYVYYRPVSIAGDYMKETVDDPKARSCFISHLSPGKIYEIKLQCFTAVTASEFSSKLMQRTVELITENPSSTEENGGQALDSTLIAKPQLYIIIGSAVGGVTLLIGVILLLIVCKRYRRKKDQDNSYQGEAGSSSKANPSESGHIQSESKEYAKGSEPGSMNRRMYNGCPAPGVKLTITPNPLAQVTDEDKNQNVMEMSSFLTTKNNNMTSTNDSLDSPSSSVSSDSICSREIPETSTREKQTTKKESLKDELDTNIASSQLIKRKKNFV